MCSLTNAICGLPVVIVMQTTQHRTRCDFPTGWRCLWSLWLARNALLDALMGSGVVEVFLVLLHHSVQMALPQDQKVVEALSPQAADETLADCVRPRCPTGCAQHLDLCCHSCE